MRIMHLCKSCIKLKCLACHRLIIVTKNHHPGDDAEIDGDDRSMPAKAKLAYFFVVMAQA
jgi:hypothetical protein